MSHSSTITNALIMPGITAVDASWSILIGLVIDDRQIAWAECRFGGRFNKAQPEGLDLDEAIHLLQETIIPFLIGQPLANVRELITALDGIRREVEVVRPITAETPPQKRSRRELFTSLVNPDQEIREVVERPLPPEMRLGLSLALISAVAMTGQELVVETVASLYHLTSARQPLPLHLLFDDLPNPNDSALSRIAAASYGLEVEPGEAVKVLGRDGIRLQNRLRQLKNRVARYVDNGSAEPTTSFLFDLQGGYGRLYGNKSGRILGAVDGLERTTKPFGLRLVDPVIMDSWPDQLKKMKELQSFIRLRGMETKLLARIGVETAENIHALADNECCSGVVLDMARLGTLERTIELAQAAKARGLAVVLSGVQGETAVQAALAINPALMVVGVADVSAVADEMNRTIAWIGIKK